MVEGVQQGPVLVETLFRCRYDRTPGPAQRCRRRWGPCSGKWCLCVRFSCSLYFRFFQCKILIYVHTQNSTIPALFWTVLVSVDQQFL